MASPLCAEAIEPAAGVRFPPRAPVGAVHGREGPPIHIESRGGIRRIGVPQVAVDHSQIALRRCKTDVWREVW